MVTEVVHGADAAKSAEKITAILFGDGQVSDLSTDELDLLSQSFPTATKGTQLLDILVETGLAASKGEGRKLLAGNAISVNGEKVTEDQPINDTALIKRGKNKFALVR
jgi:tyrosyl-tRNA synthetase